MLDVALRKRPRSKKAMNATDTGVMRLARTRVCPPRRKVADGYSVRLNRAVAIVIMTAAAMVR